MSCPELADRWKTYLSRSRVDGNDKPGDNVRSPFHKDYDRILFSPAFRRLQDKTRVYPLARNDHVRRRLTHSLEVASIGRCLGRSAANTLEHRNYRPKGVDRDAIGLIVAAACLAHDIGNPPFGHAGEQAIKRWFKEAKNRDITMESSHCKSKKDSLTDQQLADFQSFDGNAQGFRILTSLQDDPVYGGMRLTAATLSSFVKYPKASRATNNGDKIGVFQADIEHFRSVADFCGIDAIERNIEWKKHPLNCLVEAADDICYLCADVEDAFTMNLFSFQEARDLLEPLARGYDVVRYNKLNNEGKICYLVAKAIGNLIVEVSNIFEQKFNSISVGEHNYPLMQDIKSKRCTDAIRSKLRSDVFHSTHMAKIETMGFEIITYLLDNLVPAVVDQENRKSDPFCQRFLRIVTAMPDQAATRYDRLMRITDFISGMTDRYALKLYSELRGVSQMRF